MTRINTSMNKLIPIQNGIILLRRRFLQLSKGEPYKVKIKKNGELDFNGDDNLWAVKNIKDSVNHSKKNYAIVYYKNKNDVPKGSKKVKVYAKQE